LQAVRGAVADSVRQATVRNFLQQFENSRLNNVFALRTEVRELQVARAADAADRTRLADEAQSSSKAVLAAAELNSDLETRLAAAFHQQRELQGQVRLLSHSNGVRAVRACVGRAMRAVWGRTWGRWGRPVVKQSQKMLSQEMKSELAAVQSDCEELQCFAGEYLRLVRWNAASASAGSKSRAEDLKTIEMLRAELEVMRISQQPTDPKFPSSLA
jgi:hypothetical protein